MSAQLTDEAAFDFNPMTSPHRQDPHLFYCAARERPVTFSPSIGAYMVTRYADLITVLDDPETFSSKAALPMIYANPPEVTAVLEEGNVPETTMVVNEDEPAHIRFRRVFDAGFTGARVRAMVPLMRDQATTLIDGFTGGWRRWRRPGRRVRDPVRAGRHQRGDRIPGAGHRADPGLDR